MPAQVSLAITIDIQFPNGHATDDWTLPDAGADSFTTPVDIAWKTDVNRYNSSYHIVVLERVGVGNYPFTIKPADAAPSAIFMI
jgi:hypothetical protein